MNTNRAAKIANIIEKRRPLAEKIASVEVNLQSLSFALRTLEEHRNQLLTRVDEPNIAGRLREIDLATIQQKIEEESKKLGTLKERFSRRTLNIGVVGLMGQGKSTLLKSLSGLSDNEIPALEGGACTAVRSMIENQPGETEAEVTLHSEDSFFNQVIYPYYEELGFENKPTSLDDFAKTEFPQAQSTGATNEKMYKHLRDDYHANLNQYRYLLKPGKPRKQPIQKEEIPEYVIQKRDVQGRLITFKHLAVREVKIFCSFPTSDIGKIALVDVPGLGDSKLGDEKLMLKTLGQEVDIVLFIRRPDPLRYQWQPVDTQLYDTAARALNNLLKRSFMVLNHSVRTDNLKACKSLQETLDTIKVVKCEIADCSNSDDANKVFDLVLAHLVDNIESLDNEYAASCQEEIIRIQSEVKAELEKASKAFSQAGKLENEFPVFVPLFNKLWHKIKEELETQLEKLKESRDEVDVDFKQKVDEALQACRNDTGIPSIEQIEARDKIEKGYGTTYEKYLNEIRAHLSQHFLSLDEGLKRSLDRVKSQVAEVLIEKGSLGGLTQAKGSEFIKAIVQQIPDQLILGKPSKVKFGFQMLAEFELSYRGLVQHRIRQHLDGLTPNEPAVLQLGKVPNAQQVLINLKTAQDEAVYKCENALKDLLCEPSQAAFAIVEEFLDRIFRAADVESEWQIFLYEVRSLVWRDEFEKMGDHTKLRQDWLNAVEQATAVNQLDSIRFLN